MLYAFQLMAESVKCRGYAFSANSCSVMRNSPIYQTVWCNYFSVPIVKDQTKSFQVRSQNCQKRRLAWSCLSVCPHGKTQLSLDRLSWNLIFECISKYVHKIQVSLKSDRQNEYLHDDLCRFMIVSRWIPITMRNVSEKNCREKQIKYFIVE